MSLEESILGFLAMEFYICVHRADSYLGDCMPTDMKTLVTGLYDLLEPADPSERKKALKAAMAMLGDDASVTEQKEAKGGAADNEVDDGELGLNQKVKTWMSRNSVTVEQINHIFHIEDETVDLIADTPHGKNQKEQSINAYLLAGVAEFLKTGQTTFTDKAGREACKKMGCYGDTNHATYLKKPGNILSGSKERGWTVTGPGLKAGAELVKQLNPE
ncbi:hypothetical protein FXB41_34605 [Bradyrhizobium canariense]|uniref:hypothetical protein n=1 Tax=Bradyrhizobium canariense TaxID=255045 RepID=UPI001CA59769|nr:hypothetical protein [Bradyrhizobium canariense]MBW5439702.1 hypothetical protein [Bradyrhizobium canariense]